MSSEWREYAFEEVIDFQEGPGILAKDFRETGIPLIRLAGLGKGAAVLDGCNYLDPELVETRYAHFKVKRGDILLSTSASLGRTAVVDEVSEGSIVYTGIIRMRPANENLYPPFILYLLESPHFQMQVEAMGAGSVIRHFGPSHLRQMTVEIPSVLTQRRIADILSALDDKIELNRQTNATLEAIAQAIFKEWFVDFNFPLLPSTELPSTELPSTGSGSETVQGGSTGSGGGNTSAELVEADTPREMQESELGLIPAGWRVGTLGEEGNFKNGINYSRDENGDSEFYIVNVRDVVASKFITRQNLDSILVDRSKAIPYLLEANDILLVRSASPGETAILLKHEVGIIYSGFTIRYRLTNRLYFLYLFFIFQSLKNRLDSLANGTTLKNINQGILNPYQIVLPDETIIREFNQQIELIFQIIENNSQNSRTLAQIRDTLLPKLMRGEIDV